MTQTQTVQFTLNIPSDLVSTVTECLCLAGGYTPTGDAATDDANAKKTVIAWITQTVANVQAAQNYTPPPAPKPISGLS